MILVERSGQAPRLSLPVSAIKEDTLYSDDHRDPTAACVEFTFRVHSDGRRERLAAVLVRDRDGIYRPGPRRPSGDLARFAAQAVAEAMEELAPRKRANRLHALTAPERRPR